MTWTELFALAVVFAGGFLGGAIWRAKSDRWTDGEK